VNATGSMEYILEDMVTSAASWMIMNLLMAMSFMCSTVVCSSCSLSSFSSTLEV